MRIGAPWPWRIVSSRSHLSGAGEYRFAGWSEQRTLQFTDDGVLLRVRHGRVPRELHVAATVDLR